MTKTFSTLLFATLLALGALAAFSAATSTTLLAPVSVNAQEMDDMDDSDDMDDMDDEDDMDTGMGGSDSGLVRTGGYTSSPSLAFGLIAVSLVAAGATGLYASNR